VAEPRLDAYARGELKAISLAGVLVKYREGGENAPTMTVR